MSWFLCLSWDAVPPVALRNHSLRAHTAAAVEEGKRDKKKCWVVDASEAAALHT